MNERAKAATSSRQPWLAVWLLFGTMALTSPAGLAAAAPEEKFNVLILGDSLALCGFGERLDERFRNHPAVSATFTYMACGTNPLSWLKQRPYMHARSLCGFWTIESVPESAEPREMQDTYGIKRNQAPKAHEVPKLEDLLAQTQADVLVIQTGSNLFGLFPDAKTVRASRHAPALKKYLLPFKEQAMSPPSRLRKIYWVNPPTSGRVGKAVQDFVFEQTEAQLAPPAVVIDSRKLVSYPYKNMDPDKEHFIGEQMTEWADEVFAIVQRDLAAQPLAGTPPLSESNGFLTAASTPAEAPPARAAPVDAGEVLRAEPAFASNPPAPAESPKKKTPLQVRARLMFKTEPISLQELLPYRESLVGYVYDVEKVLKGEYHEQQVLVMHPAHIGLKEQRLDKYRIGKRYKLRLDPMEGTLWETAKTKDESGQINLQPYLQVEDKSRHPQSRKQ